MTNYVCNSTYELVENQNFSRTGEPDKASYASTSTCARVLVYNSLSALPPALCAQKPLTKLRCVRIDSILLQGLRAVHGGLRRGS